MRRLYVFFFFPFPFLHILQIIVYIFRSFHIGTVQNNPTIVSKIQMLLTCIQVGKKKKNYQSLN